MNHKNKRDTDLLWTCFINWAETLEKIEKSRKKNTEQHDIKSKSKTTHAIKLFSEGNSTVEVAIALDLPTDQVRIIYREYWELACMD
jgi:hypothetical protein